METFGPGVTSRISRMESTGNTAIFPAVRVSVCVKKNARKEETRRVPINFVLDAKRHNSELIWKGK